MESRSVARWSLGILAVLGAGCFRNWSTFEIRDGATGDGTGSDTAPTDANCGFQGAPCCPGVASCGLGLVCTSGSCQLCPAGTVECGGVCVNLVIDPMNCGRCARVCPTDRVCRDSNCVR